MLKTSYRLAKPGIVYGNVMTTAASFLLACRWHIDWTLLIATIVGTSLIIGAACVCNNVLDRRIDEKMVRTSKRALATGAVSPASALMYAAILGFIGFLLLAVWVNWLTFVIGAIGIFFYVVVYGIAKRHTVHGTLVGSISGAMPIVAGYTAVANRLDSTALILFLILAFWQMPHFYAIGLYRLKDYKQAGLPIWPVVRGTVSTKRWIVIYTALYVLAAVALGVFGFAGWIYTVIVGLLGVYWLLRGLRGLGTEQSEKWARGMFGLSLINLLVLSAALATGSILP